MAQAVIVGRPKTFSTGASLGGRSRRAVASPRMIDKWDVALTS
jgi:hypothetical protein